MFISQLVAIFCCTIFTGAGSYCSLVEHPARLACGTNIASTVFPGSFYRAAVMQVILAAIGSTSAAIAWMYGADVMWLVGGLIFSAIFPFTWFALMPINRQLLSPKVDKNAKLTNELLVSWGRFNTMRVMISFLALCIFYTLIYRNL